MEHGVKSAQREHEPKIKTKPVISSRLPKAFSNPLSKKKKTEHSANSDEMRNLKKLLSPLKLNPEQRSKMKHAIKQLEQFPSFLENQAAEGLRPTFLPAPTVHL